MLEYHAALVGDEPRTRAFFRAIESAVTPGCRVLDVGTGTGILALHAARLGAEVVAVEESDMFDYARAMARANNASIDFRHGNVKTLAPDAIAPVDVIVSEMIGNILLEEEIIPIFAAARRFLKPGGRLIPSRVRFHAAPCFSERVDQASAFWRTPHFDLDWSPLAACMDHHPLLDREPHAALIGPGVPLPWIELAEATDDRHAATVLLTPDRDAVLNAVMIWWEAELAPGIVLSQAPADAWPGQHWFRTLLPVASRAVAAGEPIPLCFAYDGDQEPDLWSWSLGSETRSSFFAFPPDRERRARTLR